MCDEDETEVKSEGKDIEVYESGQVILIKLNALYSDSFQS